MSIHVEIPEPLAEKVASIAKSQGKSPDAVVLEMLANQLEPMGQLRMAFAAGVQEVSAVQQDPMARLNSALAPIREAFQESGLSEDEAVELFEAEKHAMRREHTAGK